MGDPLDKTFASRNSGCISHRHTTTTRICSACFRRPNACTAKPRGNSAMSAIECCANLAERHIARSLALKSILMKALLRRLDRSRLEERPSLRPGQIKPSEGEVRRRSLGHAGSSSCVPSVVLSLIAQD